MPHLSLQADITNVGIGSVGHIYTPHALPAFRDDGCETKARAKRKERADPIKSKKPGRDGHGSARASRAIRHSNRLCGGVDPEAAWCGVVWCGGGLRTWP